LVQNPAFNQLDEWITEYEHIQPGTLASEEDFREGIRKDCPASIRELILLAFHQKNTLS